MKSYFLLLLFCAAMLLDGAAGVCATFSDRLWEKYAGIRLPEGGGNGSLVAMPLDLYQLEDMPAKIPFADLRVVTDRKEEIPWQIVSMRPEMRLEVVGCRMRNLSTTANGDTWAELLVDANGVAANAMQIISPDTNYIRKVEVLGSRDGKAWQTLRKDGVIFDLDKGEKLKNDRIFIPETTFSHFAIRIANSGKSPLTITEVRLFRQRKSAGEVSMIPAKTEQVAFDDSKKESRIVVRMEKIFPVDRLVISTKETNFQRSVTVESKNSKGVWTPVSEGVIYSFDSPDMHSSRLFIAIPGISARDFRLVFRNHDTPPLAISNVFGEGYRRILVFKTWPDRRFYLFWGNPSAEYPRYDLSGVATPEAVERLPVATLCQACDNPSFAGDKARLPLSERYRFLLYGVVVVAIAALLFMQYRVFKRIPVDDEKKKI